MLDSGKEMYLDKKALENMSTRHKSLIRLLKSPSIMAFGISTIFLTENPNEFVLELNYYYKRNKLEVFLT